MSTVTLTVELVLSGDHIDETASLEACRTAISQAKAARETEQTEIALVVSDLFDQHYGKPITMPTLASLAAQKLNAQPENFAALSARVLAYVRANHQGEVKDGVEERGNSLFVVQKGAGGGVFRRADRPAKNS